MIRLSKPYLHSAIVSIINIHRKKNQKEKPKLNGPKLEAAEKAA